jgi:predicted XRE-type DNA-binding protein/CheY-like chemotaxis protein
MATNRRQRNQAQGPDGGSSGFEEQAVNLLIRSELILAIERSIKEREWTQTQAAQALGISQPRVSDLMNGRIERFTVDMLMILADRLGKYVSIQLQDGVFSTTEKVRLLLFVRGEQQEQRALNEVQRLFRGDSNKFEVLVVDVNTNPGFAEREGVTATPTLIKEFPPPRAVLIGDLSESSVRWQLNMAQRLVTEEARTPLSPDGDHRATLPLKYTREKPSDKVSILLIEDSEIDAELLQDHLFGVKGFGFAIDHVETLKEGVDKMSSSDSYDIVLLDLGLPDTLGLSTFKRAYEQFGNRCPIIVLTGLDDREMSMQTLNLGAENYVLKGGPNYGQRVASAIIAAMARSASKVR